MNTDVNTPCTMQGWRQNPFSYTLVATITLCANERRKIQATIQTSKNEGKTIRKEMKTKHNDDSFFLLPNEFRALCVQQWFECGYCSD